MIIRSISIERWLWEAAKGKAKRNGFSISAIVRALLSMWIKGEVEVKV